MEEANKIITEIEQEEQKLGKKLLKFYNKNYKLLLLIPLILLILSLSYIGYFYKQNQDFIKRDVSLTGGTTITIFSEQEEINIEDLTSTLSHEIDDFNIRELSDFRTGKQEAVTIELPIEDTSSEEYKTIVSLLEDSLGKTLVRGQNFNEASTGSTLGEGFYKQLIYAIILAFSFMAVVVFFIFGSGMKIKITSSILVIIPVLLFMSKIISLDSAILINSITLLINLIIFLKYSIPSIAVVLSAFADIVMTLALVDLLGIRVSSAGIIAFLMLIGYSVDTDIMLTTRLLKRQGQINTKLKDAFKTGLTMTITSIIALSVALIITQSFSPVLKQIFTILLIGLGFDIFNTWITNASILKWYLEKKERMN